MRRQLRVVALSVALGRAVFGDKRRGAGPVGIN